MLIFLEWRNIKDTIERSACILDKLEVTQNLDEVVKTIKDG